MAESRITGSLTVRLVLAFSMWGDIGFAQTLPESVSCRDLLDIASGRLSRSMDGGKTYSPVKIPQPKDNFEKVLIDYDTYLCQRAARREITSEQFSVLHNEKSRHLQAERNKALAEQGKPEPERQTLQDQQPERENREEALQAQPLRQRAEKSANYVLLVPANARQSKLVDHGQRLAEWRIVEKYDDYAECESAKALIAGLSYGNDSGTSEAFMIGVCVNAQELKRANRN